jgi:TonB family protein
MEINFVAGKFPKVVVAVLLAACFSFESLAFAVAAPPAAVASALTQAAWQRVNAREDNFSVMLPARPEITGNREFTFGSNGEFINEERIASTYHNGVVYLVRMYDTSNPKRLLSKYPAIRQISSAVESNVSVGGIEGKQLVKKNEGFVHVIRLFPTKKRLYVLEAAARDENHADIRRFVSSLTLGDTAATASDKTDPAAGSANAGAAPLPVAPDTEPLSEKEVTHPAVLIYRPQPPYPARAKQLGISGTLKFRVVFSPSGEVTDIKVTQGLGGGLSEAVAPIVKSIKFLPAVKDGRLVPQYAEISYNFRLG